MPVFNNILAGASGQATGYEIEQSVRFDEDNSSAYLYRTPSGAGNRKTFTISFWFKYCPNADTGDFFIFEAGTGNSPANYCYLEIYQEKLYFRDATSGSSNWEFQTSQLFRDVSAWYHCVIAVDTTQASSGNRVKIYLNGSQITAFGTETQPSQDYDSYVNNTVQHAIGASKLASNHYFDGYLAEFHLIDGTALTPASFGETNEDTNQWQAIKYAGSYGTNGFYLKFQDSSALGDDSSGNTNDFTVTNLVASDQVLDSPTNNFAVMNPLDNPDNRASGSTFSEGNLKVSEVGGNDNYTMIGNFGMSSGKWYFEFCGVNSDNTWMLGIGDMTKNLSRGYTGTSGDGLFVYVDGDTYTGSTSASYGVSWTHGDVMGVAVDLDNNALYFAKNNTWMNSGDPASGSSKTGAAFTTQLADRTWAACMGRGSTANTITGTFNFGQDSSFAGAKTAQGNGPDGTDLYYDPPSGYIPMCTAQMADPSIADSTKHFNTILYDDGSGAKTGVGFQPDLVWVKSRGSAYEHELTDSVRGVTKALSSDSTNAESTDSTGLTAFGSDGFTVGADTNYSDTTGSGMVAWNWKAGGTASTNENGSIDSSVSANTTAGFSIVSWAGTGSNVTVGHGLSQAPELIINKSRTLATSSSQWAIQSILWNSASDTNILYLQGTGAASDDTNVFQAAPTSTVFSPQGGGWAGIGASGEDYIAYCFHSVEGYSKVGTYVGNSVNGDGSFVYTGFRPAFVFIKRVTTASSNSYIVDNKRIGYNYYDSSTDYGSNKYLWPDSTAADGNGTAAKGMGIDLVSNGFKIRSNSSDYNASGNTYLYLAFAESPFKTSNAR